MKNEYERIFAQKGFKETDGKEITIARFRLKQLGENSTIILNNKTDMINVKSADAFENGIRTEYKRITKFAKNIKTSIQNVLRGGKEQVNNIVILIESNYDVQDIADGINNAEAWDKKNKIKNITLIDNIGREIKI